MNAEIKSKVESLSGVLENKRKFWRMAIGEYYDAYTKIKNDVNSEKFRGCFVEHIRVEDEYKIAVEKCMGGVLLNMICDDQETTDKVVKCIDKYKLPRITIFTISDIHSSSMDYRIDKNEVSPLKNFIK